MNGPGAIHSMTQVAVVDLRVGDLVDLESCPYLAAHSSASFEYGRVAHVERETDQCVVIGYEGIDHVGYPADTVLLVQRTAEPSNHRR